MMKDAKTVLLSHWEQIQRQYTALDPRQQHAVWGLLLLGIVVASVTVVVNPTRIWYQQQYQRWHTALDDQQWLESQQARAALLQQYRQQSSASTTPLLSLVTSSAKAQSLTIDRYEPRSDDELDIWMDQVSHAAVMPWLRQLLAQDGALHIRELSLRAADQPGFVTVSVELTR